MLLEVTAIYIIWNDYKNRNADLASQGRRAMVTGLPGPTGKSHGGQV